jgi:gamma-glutamyl:cysteine ligase YbdK (ATP-grasp superfamily)
VAWRSCRGPPRRRAALVDRRPEAERLGCAHHLAGVERLLGEGNGAQRQVRAYHEGKSLVEVYRETVLRAHADAGVPVAPSELGV